MLYAFPYALPAITFYSPRVGLSGVPVVTVLRRASDPDPLAHTFEGIRPGARVWFDRWTRETTHRPGWPMQHARPVRSGPDGSFRLDGVPLHKTVVVNARARDGATGASLPLKVLPESPEARDIEVRGADLEDAFMQLTVGEELVA